MARSFNGTTDKIDCGSSAVLEPYPLATFAGWINPNTPSTYATLFGSDSGGTAWGLFIKSNLKLAFYMGGFPFYDGTGTYTLSNNVWWHVALTFDSGATPLGIGYVNGLVDGSGGNVAMVPAPGANFVIAAASSGASPFPGSIVDVGVWNATLTASEILSLANGARPKNIRRQSLQGYWPLDGLSSPEPDLSGNVFNGTVTGTAFATGAPIMLFSPRQPSFLDAVTAPPSTNLDNFFLVLGM